MPEQLRRHNIAPNFGSKMNHLRDCDMKYFFQTDHKPKKSDKPKYESLVEKNAVIERSNFFTREKNSVTAEIYDFKSIPQFQIYTPTFNFDSYENSKGWHLLVKQQRYGANYKLPSIKLIYATNNGQRDISDSIRIRPSTNICIKSLDDVARLFYESFEIVQTSKLAIQNKPLSAYSDSELLNEIHRRTMERVGDYREPAVIRPHLVVDNVIKFPPVKPIEIDEERLAAIFAA